MVSFCDNDFTYHGPMTLSFFTSILVLTFIILQVPAGATLPTIIINPFMLEFLIWTLPSQNLDTSIVANRGFSQKPKTDWQTVWILMRWLVASTLFA